MAGFPASSPADSRLCKLSEIYGKFLNLADQKKEVCNEDLHALMGNTEIKNSISRHSVET